MNNLSLKKHILEIRFQPLPSFLDKKGQLTEVILNDLFDTWVINPNKADIVSTSNKNIAAYITYFNYGLTSESPNTSELFVKQAEELIKKLWTIIPSSSIQRFGLRTYQIYPEKRSLDVLVGIYKNKCLSISEKKLNSFGGKLVDIGIALNFDDEKNARFNMNTGPMLKEQSKQFFSNDSLLPKTGIFFDIDFFNENQPQLINYKQKDFLELIKKGINKAEEVQDAVLEILNEKNNK